MNHVHPNAVKSELDAPTVKLFRAVSFEAGEVPSYEDIHTLFIESGLLIKNTTSAPEISSGLSKGSVTRLSSIMTWLWLRMACMLKIKVVGEYTWYCNSLKI